MAKLHYRSYNPNQIILFPQRKVLLEQVDEAIAQDKCNVDEKNKENSQLKCISLKLRVLIYIEGVFELLTHPLSLYIRSLRIENYIRKHDFLFANFMTISANVH